jgi:hypothetical protein
MAKEIEQFLAAHWTAEAREHGRNPEVQFGVRIHLTTDAPSRESCDQERRCLNQNPQQPGRTLCAKGADWAMHDDAGHMHGGRDQQSQDGDSRCHHKTPHNLPRLHGKSIPLRGAEINPESQN